ncbi:hypothetical protein PVAP13_9NG107900 [Panicum virgatum]|uniref:Uncharacterized protein n=1 Tax=Panicum virgatum TaxID=38727 RepID=A0A8T0MEG2_PANVG|nr:hypothetical protein PVAP13_9NG107900 [Panicum virgatum]
MCGPTHAALGVQAARRSKVQVVRVSNLKPAMDWTGGARCRRLMDPTESGKKEVFQALYEVRLGRWGAFLPFVRSAVRGGVFLSVALHAWCHRLSYRSCTYMLAS